MIVNGIQHGGKSMKLKTDTPISTQKIPPQYGWCSGYFQEKNHFD